MSTSTMTAPAQLIVDIEDVDILNKVKNALKLMKGVGKISIHKQKKTGLERAWEDVRAGRVTRWNSADEMFDALMRN